MFLLVLLNVSHALLALVCPHLPVPLHNSACHVPQVLTLMAHLLVALPALLVLTKMKLAKLPANCALLVLRLEQLVKLVCPLAQTVLVASTVVLVLLLASNVLMVHMLGPQLDTPLAVTAPPVPSLPVLLVAIKLVLLKMLACLALLVLILQEMVLPTKVTLQLTLPTLSFLVNCMTLNSSTLFA